MLKRAKISLVAAAIPGLISYAGLFDNVAPVANLIFFILFAFAVLSFLFCLFEDEPAPSAAKVEVPRANQATELNISAGDHVVGQPASAAA